LESDDSPQADYASGEDIRSAIEKLAKADMVRLYKAGKNYLFGTEYKDPSELLNEAIMRAMNAAHGGKGRSWKKSVPFIAFLIMTMKGIANDSYESLAQTKTDSMEAMATEQTSIEEALHERGHSHRGTEEIVVEIEEAEERQALAKQDSDAIDRFFKDDSEVNWIIMGYKDGQTASEIRELSEMSPTQYETAKKRFRRGLEKISLHRRKS
jgi:hypothetical protein